MKKYTALALLIIGALFLSSCGNSAPEMEINIISPQEGAVINSAMTTIAGSVNRYRNVTVEYKLNGGEPKDANADINSAFAFDVELLPGSNTIELNATIGANTASKTLTLISQPVASAGLIVKGKIAEDGDKFTRPDVGDGLSDAARTNTYDVFTFSVESSGWYAAYSEQDFDGYLVLYKEAFDPSKPLEGAIAVNDDYRGGYNPDVNPHARSRILAKLDTGTKYILVTTACGDPKEGCGPNYGSFTTSIAPADPPPPPFVLPAPRDNEFNITIRFLTNNITAEQQAVFVEAANRWSAIIKDDLPNIEFKRPIVLSEGAAPFVGILDDVIIDVSFLNIDGPSGVLGRAGPILLRLEPGNSQYLPSYGVMQFDISEFGKGGFFDDKQAYIDTITHEMGHVLGIGTLWERTKNTSGIEAKPISGPPGLPNPNYDPRFIGERATAAYKVLLEAAGKETANSVPISNTGGPGNYNGHWRELDFENELMTPYAGGAELLSTVTAASLADIGYQVDMASTAIDNNYGLPLPATFAQISPNAKNYIEYTDFAKGSGSVGSAQASVTAVDLKLDEAADPKDPASANPANSTSGCEADDFTGFPSGNIALLQRGKCAFVTKVANAKAAGAVGVIIFNQGNTEARKGISPSAAGGSGIPVIGIGYDLGKELASTSGLVVKIDTPVLATSTITTAALAPEFNEEVLQPIGTISTTGQIKYFPAK